MADVWVRSTDAAEVFEIPPGTLRRWISEGRIRTRGKRPTFVNLDHVLAELRRRDKEVRKP